MANLEGARANWRAGGNRAVIRVHYGSCRWMLCPGHCPGRDSSLPLASVSPHSTSTFSDTRLFAEVNKQTSRHFFVSRGSVSLALTRSLSSPCCAHWSHLSPGQAGGRLQGWLLMTLCWTWSTHRLPRAPAKPSNPVRTALRQLQKFPRERLCPRFPGVDGVFVRETSPCSRCLQGRGLPSDAHFQDIPGCLCPLRQGPSW